MSELYEQRLNDVEREQVRQGERLGRIEGDVGKIGAGVDKLLERDANRPKALSWGAIGGAIAATAAGMISVAVVGWWVIGSSPAVRDLDDKIASTDRQLDSKIADVNRRVDRLDDPEIGRVPTVERKVRDLEAWQPRVTKF
jgi:hypothetical protein